MQDKKLKLGLNTRDPYQIYDYIVAHNMCTTKKLFMSPAFGIILDLLPNVEGKTITVTTSRHALKGKPTAIMTLSPEILRSLNQNLFASLTPSLLSESELQSTSLGIASVSIGEFRKTFEQITKTLNNNFVDVVAVRKLPNTPVVAYVISSRWLDIKPR